MHRNTFLNLLENYSPTDPQEILFNEQITSFVHENPDCFERSLLIGHVTGSAWIVDKSRQFTLLTHHRKLDKWFQTGGHCDGNSDVLNVALKEAQEETGLSDIQIINPKIFDIDIHEIPERREIPTHLHYDVRFLFEANMNEPFTISSESTDLAWVALSDVSKLNDSESIMRMIRKMNKIIY